MDPITILTCATLYVIDGDTIKCDGERLRILGDGAPFTHGVDTPEIGFRAKCHEENRMSLLRRLPHSVKDSLARRSAPPVTAQVRPIRQKLGLPEPRACLVASLAFGEALRG